MTNQEAFNIVWNHFIIEEKPPGINENGCVFYDINTGNSCAVGCLLWQEERFRDTLGTLKGNFASIMAYPDIREYFSGCDTEFLQYLQRIHDYSATTSTISFTSLFKEYIGNLASRYNLIIPSNHKQQ